MDRDQVLAFRLARHGLDARRAATCAEAVACPASDYSRGSAALSIAARRDGVTRESYERAVDAGELVVGPSLRAAIHALAPQDGALYGRALIAEDEAQLLEQLGPAAERHLQAEGIAALEALEEVAEATRAALGERGALSKDKLHAELRERVREPLLPWCEGCDSHHVSPMLWRYGAVRSGARCDSSRRYLLAGPRSAPPAARVVHRWLHYHGPASVEGFAAWAGVARAHANALWAECEGELVEVKVDGHLRWLLAPDERALASPPAGRGVRLLPPRDPYLQQPDRELLVPDPEIRRRLFTSAGGPGAVLADGRLAGLWRVRARRQRIEIEVDALEPIDAADLQAQAETVAAARGARSADVHRS